MPDPHPNHQSLPEGKYAGLWLPLEILEDPDLTLTQKVIFAMISALDSGKGFWMTNETLAQKISCSSNYASISISHLQKKGYIRIHQPPGGRRIIETIDRLALRGYLSGETPGYSNPIPSLSKIESPSDRIEERKEIKNKGKGISEKERDDLLNIGQATDPIFPWKQTPAWLDAWVEWIDYRKERKPRLSPSAAKKQIIFLAKNAKDEAQAIEILERSIMNSWMGLFPLPGSSAQAQKPRIRVDYKDGKDDLR